MFRGLVENKSRNVGLGACGKQTRCCWCRYFELQVNFLFFFLKKKKNKKKKEEKKNVIKQSSLLSMSWVWLMREAIIYTKCN
jgi:hypothetical protein